MDALKVAIPVDVVAATPKLMSTDGVIGARVSSSDIEPRDIDDFRGTTTVGSPSWLKKLDSELCRNNYQSSRSSKDVSLGFVDGMTSGSTILISEYGRKNIQKKVGKVPRNGNGFFKKPRVSQSDSLLPQLEGDDSVMECDKLGLQLTKCSNGDKGQLVKQKNNINGRRGDRRNSKVLVKAKFDQISMKVGTSNYDHANGGTNVFGMYGLKPVVHDISKLMDDISLNELLDGTYKCLNTCIDKEKKVANVTVNILDSVKKACALVRLRGVQQVKQDEEIDTEVNNKVPSLSSPCNTRVENCSNGDDCTLVSGLSTCGKDLESSMKIEIPSNKKDIPFYKPRDVFKKLALPPSKELDSLLQDALKPLIMSSKLGDSRNGKQLSHRIILPPFPWSQNFNGNYKSNNDAVKISNRSTCQGRWVRIKSKDNSNGEGNKDFLEFDSLSYDNNLVPSGTFIYKVLEIDIISSPFSDQKCCKTDFSPSAQQSPKVITAAQILCDISSDFSTHMPNGLLKWSKQKSIKAQKSRSSKKPNKISTPKSETLLDHMNRNSIEHQSSSKKSKISMLDGREDTSHIHTVIGLSSVSGPRSNRSSPSRLSRDYISETRNLNGSFIKPPFVAPSPKVMDRSSHNPKKL